MKICVLDDSYEQSATPFKEFDFLPDPLRYLPCLGGVGREAVVGHRYAGALDDLARLVLEESHRGAEAYTAGAATNP